MLYWIRLSIAGAALSAAACTRAPPPPPAKAEKNGMIQVGEASFYNKNSAGQKTASGETLKLDRMTAASKMLPLGARAQVTNRDTGQTAIVRINDRGPYVEGRVIDLTPRAARNIGIDRTDGVAPVTIKPVAATIPPN